MTSHAPSEAEATPLDLFDAHAHVDGAEFDEDRAEVLTRARAAGVRRLVCIGSGRDVANARRSVALAETADWIWATIGIHPHDVAHMVEDDWQALLELGRHPRVVAIGETGLDYHYDYSPREQQRAAFIRFVELARTVGKPVVCHIRDAHEEARDILRATKAFELGVVIHCFTGTPADAAAYVELGAYISFSGIATFKTGADLREAAKLVPLDRLMIETDCPYLAPIPYRGKRNEPAFIAKTAEVLAAVREMDLGAFAASTTRAAKTFYRIG